MRTTGTLIRGGLLALALALPGSAVAEEPEPLHLRVDRAIDKGVEWVKGQARAGAWDTIRARTNYEGGSAYHQYPMGPTALALLTLLKCGVPPKSDVIEDGFQVLRTEEPVPRSTYEICAVILAIEARTNQVKRERKREEIARMKAKPGEVVNLKVKLPKKDKAWMQELVKALMFRFRQRAWRYGLRRQTPTGWEDIPHPHGDHDMSNTHFAMMALHVANRCGIKVDARTVAATVQWTLEMQEKDGPEHLRATPGNPEPAKTGKPAPAADPPAADRARGWAYLPTSPMPHEKQVSGSMTTAGIVVLLTGREILRTRSPRMLKKIDDQIQRGIDDGIAWLDRNWSIETAPPKDKASWYHFLHLWGLERVGDLKRVHYLGAHDWYTEGAEYLVANQEESGRWVRDDTHNPQDLLNTCFALLFLDRATLVATTKR